MIPLPEGHQVDRYRISGHIGTGAFGAVYRAHDPERGIDVAVKVLHPELAHGESVIRFVREARLLAQLRHPNLVQVMDFGAPMGGRPFLVMELLEGVDLEQYVRRRACLPAREVLSILEGVACALEALHGAGAVHRDVKAANVFICERNGERRVVLLDLGVAQLRGHGTTRLTASHVALGTPACMAPEQFLGGELDARTDVYALGALAFHLLTGALPFDGTTPAEVQQMHRTAMRPRPSMLAPVSPSVDEIVCRAMAIAPGDRPSTPGSFVRALAAAIEGSTSTGDGVIERCAAVHAEIRPLDDSEHALACADEAIAAMLSGLRCLGFQIALETSTAYLLLQPLELSAERDAAARRSALAALREIFATVDQDRVSASFVLHAGDALFGDDEALGGELLDLDRWVPPTVAPGVFATAEALDSLDAPAVSEPGTVLARITQATEVPVQSTVVHNESLAQLGRMLAGLVHELKNSFQIAQANMSVARDVLDRHPAPAEAREALAEAVAGAERSLKLCGDILCVASVDAAPRSIDVVELVESAVSLVRNEVRAKAKLQIRHNGPSRVHGVPGRLTQVLVNLLLNAAQAIDQEGRIEVVTTTENGRVRITVTDTGAGMSADVVAQLGQPFFTTKATGTGLGLSVTREIIVSHGGHVDVESAPGRGSSLTIDLPAA